MSGAAPLRRGGVPEEETVRLGGHDIRLRTRISRRARRISLSIDAAAGAVELVLPRGTPRADGTRFLADKADWVAAGVAALPARVPFADGVVIPLLGRPHRIRRRPELRGAIRVVGGEILVPGGDDDIGRRLGAWLRLFARHELGARAHQKAAALGHALAGVSARDTRSRWGSCSASGRLNFCWRLVLAPEWVLDYVVAHEVAHLDRRDHGPRFWIIVSRLCAAPDAARQWLRDNGVRLHRYG